MAERGQPSFGLVPIAEHLPATLAKDAAPETIADGQTPDAYGLGTDKPGYLYYNSSPSAGTVWNGITAFSEPTNHPVNGAWKFAYNRLWGYAGSALLYYGAYGYDDDYILQGTGYVPCDSQESTDIMQVVPFGGNIAVFKTDCLYVIRNADSPGAGFAAEYVKQSSGLPVAGNVIAMDNVLYWANTYGVFAYDGQNIMELTYPIRNNLGAFASGQIATLRADFAKKKIIGRSASATKFIIVPGDKPELYDYSTAGFRFTTRTLMGAESEPLLVDKVSFAYQYSADEQAAVDFAVKINDTWKTESQLKIRPANDNGRIEASLTNMLACRKFALRLTGMTASLYISKIMVHVKTGGVLGYSSK